MGQKMSYLIATPNRLRDIIIEASNLVRLGSKNPEFLLQFNHRGAKNHALGLPQGPQLEYYFSRSTLLYLVSIKDIMTWSLEQCHCLPADITQYPPNSGNK